MSDWPRNRNGDSDAYGDAMETSENTELAAVGRELRAVFVADPDPELTEAHLAAILAEAERVAAAGAERASTATSRGRRLAPRPALALRLAAVVASAFVASAGLALAGVRPPEPFSDLFEGIGFDVPGSDRANSDSPGAPGDTSAVEQLGSGRTDGADASQAGGRTAGVDGVDQRTAQGEEASAEGQATAEDARDDGGPPREPGRSEDHPASPATPSSPLEAGTAEQTESGTGGPAGDVPAGGSQDQTSAGGAEGSEPLIDPTPKPEATPPGNSAGDGPHGLAVSAEERPVESPGQPASEPATSASDAE